MYTGYTEVKMYAYRVYRGKNVCIHGIPREVCMHTGYTEEKNVYRVYMLRRVELLEDLYATLKKPKSLQVLGIDRIYQPFEITGVMRNVVFGWISCYNGYLNRISVI